MLLFLLWVYKCVVASRGDNVVTSIGCDRYTQHVVQMRHVDTKNDNCMLLSNDMVSQER